MSVSSTRIDAVVPYDIPVNSILRLVVRKNLSLSTPERVTVSRAQPAIFTKDNSGKGQGRIYGVAADGSQLLAGPGQAVQRGITLSFSATSFSATGLGAVNPRYLLVPRHRTRHQHRSPAVFP